MLLVANSTPIVDLDSKLNSFLVNLESKLLLPTPESPIRTTKIVKSTFKINCAFIKILREQSKFQIKGFTCHNFIDIENKNHTYIYL